MASKYTYAIWRRKSASAQVKLFEWKGDSMINGKKAGEYIARKDLFEKAYSPLKLCKAKDSTYFEVKVSGSGESAQVWAIAHGIARSLAAKDEWNRTVLKAAGLLTRDARKVERKKPGRHKARKAMQWSKR